MPPSSKMAGNSTTWAFGGGIPMGNTTGPGGPRPGPMTGFSQTIAGPSLSSTPLDPSEFPSLSENHSQQSQTTWATPATRNVAPSTNPRLPQQSTITTNQQEDIYSPTLQSSNSQGGFRFGAQNADRGSNLMSGSGFSAQSTGLGFGYLNATTSIQSNGLLNAISNNSRANSSNIATSRITPPASLSDVPNSRSLNEQSSKDGSEQEGNSYSSTKPSTQENNTDILVSRQSASQNPVLSSKRAQKTVNPPQSTAEEDLETTKVQDILSGMTEIDRWGLKGFSMMMNNFPSYAALVTGSDLSSLGFDISSSELISDQIFSLWDNEPPRPVLPPCKLPECYTVSNVAQLEMKLTNLNDEALIFMFYSSPGDIQQVMAAQELHNRNWRYHKKLQLWLTKDEMMVPQTIGNGTERGYYIFFDVKSWQRERRELTLAYDDLESLPNTNPRLG